MSRYYKKYYIYIDSWAPEPWGWCVWEKSVGLYLIVVVVYHVNRWFDALDCKQQWASGWKTDIKGLRIIIERVPTFANRAEYV